MPKKGADILRNDDQLKADVCAAGYVRPNDHYFLTAENNPDTMTALGRELGLASTLAWQDVFSLDETELLALLPRPAHAILLVFPVSEAHNKARETDQEQSSNVESEIIWIKQTIGNACGLMGLLHSLINGSARHHIGMCPMNLHGANMSRVQHASGAPESSSAASRKVSTCKID